MTPEESIRKLEGRVSALESRDVSPASPKLFDLAELPFKAVLDADYHLDDKASRILSAMAFLTAAAAAIFAKAYSPGVPENDLRQKLGAALSPYVVQGAPSSPAVVESVLRSLHKPGVYIWGWDLSLLAFLGYMIFILTGAAFYLAALGPALNKPSSWLVSGSQEIRSRLFYDFIARVGSKAWIDYWKERQPEEIETKIQDDYIFESQLLAEKARGKFLWMSLGSISFRLALICLIPLVASLFSANILLVRFVSISGIILLLGIFIFERVTRPPSPSKQQILHSWILWLIAFILLLLVYLVLVVTNTRLLVFSQLAVLWGIVLSAYTAYGYFMKSKQEMDRGKRKRKINWAVIFASMSVLLIISGVVITF